MIIAFTYDKELDRVQDHFGETKNFCLIDTLTNDKKIIDNGGYSHRDLIPYLVSLNVNVLICGGIGDMAISLLKDANIEVFPGINMKVLDAYEKYMQGKLDKNMNVVHKCGCH